MNSIEIINLDDYYGPEKEKEKEKEVVVEKKKDKEDKGKKGKNEEPEVIEASHPKWVFLK